MSLLCNPHAKKDEVTTHYDHDHHQRLKFLHTITLLKHLFIVHLNQTMLADKENAFDLVLLYGGGEGISLSFKPSSTSLLSVYQSSCCISLSCFIITFFRLIVWDWHIFSLTKDNIIRRTAGKDLQLQSWKQSNNWSSRSPWIMRYVTASHIRSGP